MRRKKKRDPTARVYIPRKLFMDQSIDRNRRFEAMRSERHSAFEHQDHEGGIGYWLWDSLNKPGKIMIVGKPVTDLAIVGISERHWKNSGHYVWQSGNLILSSTVGDCIIILKIKEQPVILNLIQVYAPTSTSSQDDIDNLDYGSLSQTLSKASNRERSIILGDFNAKIGETKADSHLRSVVGQYGTGVRNERGEMLIEFRAENQLSIANSYFQHHVRRLYTLRSPDRISWTAHRTNISIRGDLNVWDHERLLPGIQRRILKYFGYVIRKEGMEKAVIQEK
ncbi:hypothetical protein HUJ05_013040 [Dendroctonus ponderosae]|nr:hypothetical protein HUJ05_013040 [Dendroctonus ponderosae]